MSHDVQELHRPSGDAEKKKNTTVTSHVSSLGKENMDFSRDKEEDSRRHESDEEELEAPLPLRSEGDGAHYMCQGRAGHCQSCCSAPERYRAPARLAGPRPAVPLAWYPCPHPHWRPNPERVERSGGAGPAPGCSVSVNMPHFSLPPAGGVSQAQLEGMAMGFFTEERGRGTGLPEECRNIFITYSSDASAEILPFADFLDKQGFRPTIDIVGVPVNCTDINSWTDGFLKDPSTLIIVAVSPKYKADVEGTSGDDQGLHTKYIHSMMQNEFIQQGCLNFRFIPVLFLNASQEHVPRWLRNTTVYLWPRHSQDLLLRLQRRERYAPPPVAKEISVIIQPVPLCATMPTL